LKRQIIQVAGDMREEAKTKLNNAEIIVSLACFSIATTAAGVGG